jgi:hypothetical protein
MQADMGVESSDTTRDGDITSFSFSGVLPS